MREKNNAGKNPDMTPTKAAKRTNANTTLGEMSRVTSCSIWGSSETNCPRKKKNKTKEKQSASKEISTDSQINCINTCDLKAPMTFRIPTSLDLRIARAMDKLV